MTTPYDVRRLVTAVTVAAATATLCATIHAHVRRRLKKRERADSTRNEEANPMPATKVIVQAIEGALHASQLFIGDKLKLYETLRRICGPNGQRWTNAIELSIETSLNRRYLREWLAQQASLGVLILEDGEGDDDNDLRYRLPAGFSDVLANPASDNYLIPMVQAMPALCMRAKSSILEAFKTGIGITYDDKDVCEALNRAHMRHIRNIFIPKVLPATGTADILTKPGVICADLGCGGGNMVITLAKQHPQCKFYGYEISDIALSIALSNVRAAKLSNAYVCDARTTSLGAVPDKFDVVTAFDVLHDATDPAELMRQVKLALKPDGVWLLGDIQSLETTRENIKMAGASTLFAFSTCLCLACGTSKKDGLGLGTLGFSTAVASRMLRDTGFTRVRVVLEAEGTRWFEVRH